MAYRNNSYRGSRFRSTNTRKPATARNLSGYTVQRRTSAMPSDSSRLSDPDATMLSKESLNELRNASPITIYSDPASQGLVGAKPYALVDKMCPIRDANYGDKKVFAGNTFPLLLNNATSKLLNMIDLGTLPLSLNYLFMNIDGQSHNTAMNLEIGKAVTEALSTTQGQMFTQLPFFTRVISSPANQYRVGSSGAKINANAMPSGESTNRLTFLTWYQTNLQNISLIPARYNLVMAMQNTLKNKCYNREANYLNDLFGLLLKVHLELKSKPYQT